MALKKKHHYNPNFILRGFADDATNTLWVWDKTQQTCRPVKGTRSRGGSPRYDAFTENHYYTVTDSGGNRDLSVENYLADIEGAAAPIIVDLVAYAQSGLYLQLDFPRTERLARFLWAQHIRSPFVRSESVNSEESEQMFRDLAVEAAVSLDPDRGFIVIRHGDPKAAIETATKRAIMMEDYPGCAVDCMRRMSLDLASIVNLRHTHFVTSDRPCLVSPVLKSGGMAFMAVTKHVAVQFSRPQDSGGDLHRLRLDTVERLNRQTFETAVRFVAGPSHEYLQTLASA